MNKLSLFRFVVMALIVTCFVVSYKLETYAEIVVMGFGIMFTVAYIISEIITLNENK